MPIFERKKTTGKLIMHTLDMQIFFDNLFDIAENQREIDWIFENLQTALEFAKEEKEEAMESE